jgi:O-antigen ligase
MSRRHSPGSDDDIKYPRGVGARIPPNQRPLRPLEWVVLVHVGVFLVSTTWAFGGAAAWVRPPLAWWGSLGALLTLTALQDREALREGWLRPLWWIWPWVAFNLFVLAGCLNPSFREVKYGTETLLINDGGRVGLPSSARPALGIQALWIFDAIWISCFNLVLVVRQRRALRALLITLATNTVVLAVFGTVQRLVHAKGLFFDTVPSPQRLFFASFVYHNHWGAFIVLMMATCLGLVWHYGRRSESRDFFHSPAFSGLVAVLFLALTLPLSSSRSCTILGVALIGAAFIHWIARLVQKRRRFHESIVLPLAGALAAVVLAGVGVWYVAQESIDVRLAMTRDQIEDIRASEGTNSRVELYRDTWTMARAKPWFGWGMGSYPHVFTLFNTRKSAVDKLPVFYHDAHSDWLQALAEHGFVGTTLLALCGLVPLLRLRRRHFGGPLQCYLFGGCGLVLLYAWVEFPFGNVAVVLTWWTTFFCAVQYARLYDREAPAPMKTLPSTVPVVGAS